MRQACQRAEDSLLGMAWAAPIATGGGDLVLATTSGIELYALLPDQAWQPPSLPRRITHQGSCLAPAPAHAFNTPLYHRPRAARAGGPALRGRQEAERQQ